MDTNPYANHGIDEKSNGVDVDKTTYATVQPTQRRSVWTSAFYGGYGSTVVGKRIAPVLAHLKPPVRDAESRPASISGRSETSDILGQQIELEKGNALQYRTCSWQKVSRFFRSTRGDNRGIAVKSFHFQQANILI